jgi:uncharacterized protein YgiM (DUF1202 family)
MLGSALFYSRASWFAIIPAISICIAIPAICAAVDARITADRVNLRAGPKEQAEVVAQVPKGTILVVQGGLENDWVSVVPPANVSLWVYGDLVKDGVVAASKAQVRAGPGISYSIVGSLQKGQILTVRQTTEDWLKIAPPSGCLLWINRKYIEAVGATKEEVRLAPKQPPEPVAADEVKPQAEIQHEIQPGTQAVVRAEQLKQPPVPQPESPGVQQSHSAYESLNPDTLIGSMEQGKHVEYEGFLNYSSFVLKRPSKYILVVMDEKGRIVDSCYVLGKEAQFEALVGRQIHISGKEYWVQGVRYSVIAPDEIKLVPRHAIPAKQS